MENTYSCPLIKHDIDETICYDIQMVTGGLINKTILRDYGFSIDESKVTKERANKICVKCPFNQMKGRLIKVSASTAAGM